MTQEDTINIAADPDLIEARRIGAIVAFHKKGEIPQYYPGADKKRPDEWPVVRDADALQQAHDMAIISRDRDLGTTTLAAVHASLDVLCSLLHHDHNDTFSSTIDSLKALAEKNGYRLEKKQS